MGQIGKEVGADTGRRDADGDHANSMESTANKQTDQLSIQNMVPGQHEQARLLEIEYVPEDVEIQGHDGVL